jgi:ABC-type transport system involved in multi-copper enzyme maturation permease subunit
MGVSVESQNSMNNCYLKIWLIGQITFVEGLRHRVLWGMAVISFLLTLANVFVANLFLWDLGKISVEFGLSAFSVTGLLMIFFLGMKLLADDLDHQHIHMFLCRPVQGWEYITGKFLGLSVLLLVMAIIIGCGTTLSMAYFVWQYPAYVAPDFSWLVYFMALCCQVMMLFMVLAINFFWFSFSSQPFIALLFSVATYFVGQNMELLRKVVNENAHAGFLTGKTSLVVVVSWIFPNLSFFDKKSIAAYGLTFTGQEFFYLFLYCISYCSILLFFTAILFNRKELP